MVSKEELKRASVLYKIHSGVYLKHIPWKLLLSKPEHEVQAKINHGQTLARLNERGGLGADEVIAILEGRRWHSMGVEEAEFELMRLIIRWNKREGIV